MNPKKMTCDELHSTIKDIRADQNELSYFGRELSKSEGDFLEECEKELARRLGIKN